MHEKIDAIFKDLLSRNPDDYKEIVPYDGYVEIITSLTKILGHRAFVKYELTPDQEIVRFEINYLFGNLNQQRELTIEDLLGILRQNSGTFMTTSCFLSTKQIEGIDYTFLQSCLPFLLKWPSGEIAEMIDLVFLDIRSGFIIGPWPESIYIFQPINN